MLTTLKSDKSHPDYSRDWLESHPPAPALTGKDLKHLGLNAVVVELVPAINRILEAGAFLFDPVPANDPGRLHGFVQQ